MKTTMKYAAVAAAVLAICSCGATKQAVTSTQQSAIGTALPEEPCITLSEEAPAIRKYGNGQHFKEATAKNIAEAQARSSFARSIAAAIVAATEEIGASMSKYAGDDAQGMSVSDQSDETNDYVMSIANEIVNNTHPIKTSRYILPNRQFNIYVCLEYMGDQNQMVEDIEKKVKDKISPEDRAKIEKRHNDFRQRVLSSLSK